MLYFLGIDVNQYFSSIEPDPYNSNHIGCYYPDIFLRQEKDSPELLGPYKMSNKYKITDYISVSAISHGMVISEKVVSAFKLLNIAPHQFIDIFFTRNKTPYSDFKVLYFPENRDVLELIDWEKSRFYKTKEWHNTILEEYKFSNWDEMRDFDRKHFWGDKEFGFLRKIKIRYFRPYDLINFRQYGLPPGYVCTEKVKSLIENEGFTGFRFEPVDSEYFV